MLDVANDLMVLQPHCSVGEVDADLNNFRNKWSFKIKGRSTVPKHCTLINKVSLISMA